MISPKSQQHEIWDPHHRPIPAPPVFTHLAKASFHSFDFMGKTKAESFRMIPSKLRIPFQSLWFLAQILPVYHHYKGRVHCRRKPSHNSPETSSKRSSFISESLAFNSSQPTLTQNPEIMLLLEFSLSAKLSCI
jgi:hypothetical protein